MILRKFLSVILTLIVSSQAAYAVSPRISREAFREEAAQFVTRHYPSSPLASVSLQDAFYDAGEKNNLDPRFFVAMAAQETALYTDGCAVRHQNNNMFNWFWNPTSMRCKDSSYESLQQGVERVSKKIGQWISQLKKELLTFNTYDFVLNPGRRYCTVDCEDCLEVDDTLCRMSSAVITEEVANQCSAKLRTCLDPCVESDGCDPGCRCWSPNIAVFMQELGGDPCNIWFDSATPVSTERACASHAPSPPAECSIIAIQPSVNFGAVPMGSCAYATVVVQNQSTCDPLTGNVAISPPFRVMANAQLDVKKGEARSILIEYCGVNGVSSGSLILWTNRGSVSATLSARGCDDVDEICNNSIDDNCDGLVDENDSDCFVHASVCGNGVIESGEGCDDGDTISGDCCSSACVREPLSECASSSIIIQPSHEDGIDVWIASGFSYNDNFGVDNDVLQVGGWGDEYRALIRFDISHTPRIATSAFLSLFVISRGDNSTPTEMYFDRVSSSWDEEVSWSGKPASVGVGVIPAPSVNSWYVIDVTILYNKWQSGEHPNFGIQLRPIRTGNNFNVFYSSDYMIDPLLRPKLVIVQ